MTDDLDELERRCKEAEVEWHEVYKGPWDSTARMALPCADMLVLIERCRKAESELAEVKRHFVEVGGKTDVQIAFLDAYIGHFRKLKERAEKAEAERDNVNSWIEYHKKQYEAMRLEIDCLNAAMKEGEEAEKELASAPNEPYTEKEIDEKVKTVMAKQCSKSMMKLVDAISRNVYSDLAWNNLIEAIGDLESRLARWPEAVAKFKARFPEDVFPSAGMFEECQSVDCKSAYLARCFADEITRLATEKRDA